jgi:hypothetical protein
MSALHRFATLLLMAMHFVLAGALLGIGIPLVARIEAQLAGGYVPTGYAAVVVIAAIALGLAVATGVGLIAWARGSRRWLVISDAASTLAAWSVLLITVMANDLPFVTLVLAPACLSLAIALAWSERRLGWAAQVRIAGVRASVVHGVGTAFTPLAPPSTPPMLVP